MSETRPSPTDEVRRMLDERGIAWVARGEDVTVYTCEGVLYRANEAFGELQVEVITPLTTEQVIAATVGNAREPSDAVIERIGRFCTDYARCLVDATLHDKRPFDAVDHRTCESMEAVEDDLIRELAKDIATVGCSCASCPEMDNPDSYISHLQSALKWHDEHVPRPTNPRNTCVVLEGENQPEEVLFIGPNGVTHYLPESAGTCDGSFHESSDLSSGRVPLYYCKNTNRSIFVEREAKVCPLCGGRIREEAE